jgi:hypothetical protein
MRIIDRGDVADRRHAARTMTPGAALDRRDRGNGAPRRTRRSGRTRGSRRAVVAVVPASDPNGQKRHEQNAQERKTEATHESDLMNDIDVNRELQGSTICRRASSARVGKRAFAVEL